MDRVLCWSAGKDSTATAILAKIHKEKVDEIITVLPDPFKMELELLERFEDFMSMKVKIVPSPSFEDYFYRKKTRGKYIGTIRGWPFTVYKTCARILKWEPMQQYCKNRRCSFLIGIAKGESRKILEPNESLLIKYGLSQGQLQAFGYAVLNGDELNAEMGYINIKELIQNNVELDLYWEIKTIRKIKAGK